MASSPPPNRLDQRLAQAREQGRAALIGYLVAGDPDLKTSELVIRAVVDAGLDVLELGIPYSDPIADGPTIAAGGQRALAALTTLEKTLGLVAEIGDLVPVVLFTYFNPVFQYGIERFAARAAAAGAAGVIIPDVTLEEVEEVRGPLHQQGLALPLLISPTTRSERAARIAAASDGFIYIVSRMGVTGAGQGPDLEWCKAQVELLRRVTDKPLAVGFGISTPDQVAEVAAWSDGVIVGSGLVAAYAGSSGAEAAERAGSYVEGLAGARATAG